MTKHHGIPESDLDEILAIARSDFDALRDARIFITGGTGYIGRWLLESFRHANHAMKLNAQAVVLSRNPAAFLAAHPHMADNALRYIEGDVRTFDMPNGDFTHAIHAATDIIATNTPLETYDVTTQGTRHVLEFCRIKKIIPVLLLSSGAVYGRIPPHMHHVSEDYHGKPSIDTPDTAYGIGKMVTEWLGNTYSVGHDMRCVSARVFAQVGPYLALDKHFAVGNFVRDALSGDPFLIKGDGTPRRSYMYGVDLAAWLWRILLKGQASQAYNVGSNDALSILQLAQRIAVLSGRNASDIQVLQKPTPNTSAAWYVPDITRAQDVLGLNITVPTDEALRRTLAWYKVQGIG